MDNNASNVAFDAIATTSGALPPDDSGGSGGTLVVMDWANILYISVGALGIVDNSLVIFVLAYKRGMMESTVNVLIMNQSVLDGLSALFIVLGIVFNDPFDIPGGVWGHLYCLLWISKYQQWACFFSSTYNLVVMNYDRCFAICYPLWYRKVYSRRRLYIVMALVWLSGILFYLPYTILTYTITNDTCFILSKWYLSWGPKLAGTMVFVLLFVVPMILVALAFFKIYYAINIKSPTGSKPTKSDASSSTAKTSGKSTEKTTVDKREALMIKARKNVLKTLLVVYVALLVCWTSDQFYFFLWNIGVSNITFGNWFYHLNVNLVFFNSCINPFIYAFMYRPFKDALREIFCGKH